jgi:hypothetical protein
MRFSTLFSNLLMLLTLALYVAWACCYYCCYSLLAGLRNFLLILLFNKQNLPVAADRATSTY